MKFKNNSRTSGHPGIVFTVACQWKWGGAVQKIISSLYCYAKKIQVRVPQSAAKIYWKENLLSEGEKNKFFIQI